MSCISPHNAARKSRCLISGREKKLPARRRSIFVSRDRLRLRTFRFAVSMFGDPAFIAIKQES